MDPLSPPKGLIWYFPWNSESSSGSWDQHLTASECQVLWSLFRPGLEAQICGCLLSGELVLTDHCWSLINNMKLVSFRPSEPPESSPWRWEEDTSGTWRWVMEQPQGYCRLSESISSVITVLTCFTGRPRPRWISTTRDQQKQQQNVALQFFCWFSSMLKSPDLWAGLRPVSWAENCCFIFC